jgi:hypothetical protein
MDIILSLLLMVYIVVGVLLAMALVGYLTQETTGESFIEMVTPKKEDVLPLGVFHPSEEDVADYLNERMEINDREVINPYRGWDIYDKEE